MLLIATIGFLLWAVHLLIVVAGTFLALKKNCSQSEAVGDSLPPVSILKPLCGIDSDLNENLRSFFLLDYPCYELIFSVADPDDPAVSLVRDLMAQYPLVPSQLFLNDTSVGPNPKVNNLLRPYAIAKHDLILISDSNVLVSTDYLDQMVAPLKGDVGIVTGVVAGRGSRDFAGRMEAAYLNTFFARWMFLSQAIGFPLVMGKSMLFRKSVAEKFGGLRALTSYIAEDFWMGQKIKKLGLRVVLARLPIHQHLGEHSLSSFWMRHVRWGRIRKNQALLAFALEPVSGIFMSGTVGALACHSLHLIPLSVFIPCHLLVCSVADILMMKCQGGKLEQPHLAAWAIRELLAIPLWIHTAAGNTTLWRGTLLQLLPGGKVAPVMRRSARSRMRYRVFVIQRAFAVCSVVLCLMGLSVAKTKVRELAKQTTCQPILSHRNSDEIFLAAPLFFNAPKQQRDRADSHHAPCPSSVH